MLTRYRKFATGVGWYEKHGFRTLVKKEDARFQSSFERLRSTKADDVMMFLLMCFYMADGYFPKTVCPLTELLPVSCDLDEVRTVFHNLNVSSILATFLTIHGITAAAEMHVQKVCGVPHLVTFPERQESRKTFVGLVSPFVKVVNYIIDKDLFVTNDDKTALEYMHAFDGVLNLLEELGVLFVPRDLVF
jgi:hypothetical protein